MINHFAMFDRAIADLSESIKRNPTGQLRRHFDLVIAAIKTSQRFYLPFATDVIAGKMYDDSIKPMLHLPYDCVSVLSECRFKGDPKENPSGWKISIALNTHGAFNHRQKIFNPTPYGERSIFLLSLIYSQQMGSGWGIFPFSGVVEIPEGRDGLEFCGVSLFAGYDADRIHQEMADDINTITNLCVMLGLKNVSTEARNPPEKVNKKRISKGKRPLYSYHVLNVDGEAWDSTGEGGGLGAGVRSHLRRGHIRRLNGGDRHVWVRATFVKGSVPGFVAKDYNMGGDAYESKLPNNMRTA